MKYTTWFGELEEPLIRLEAAIARNVTYKRYCQLRYRFAIYKHHGAEEELENKKPSF